MYLRSNCAHSTNPLEKNVICISCRTQLALTINNGCSWSCHPGTFWTQPLLYMCPQACPLFTAVCKPTHHATTSIYSSFPPHTVAGSLSLNYNLSFRYSLIISFSLQSYPRLISVLGFLSLKTWLSVLTTLKRSWAFTFFEIGSNMWFLSSTHIYSLF